MQSMQSSFAGTFLRATNFVILRLTAALSSADQGLFLRSFEEPRNQNTELTVG